MNEPFSPAKGMIKHHITLQHRSPFHGLLALDKKVLGLSDVQIDRIKFFYEGTPDQEIVIKNKSRPNT